MEWTIKHPDKWGSISGLTERSRLFCAASDRGEYAVQQQNGKFAIHLDGVAITGFKYKSAVQAMQKASRHDEQLADLMG